MRFSGRGACSCVGSLDFAPCGAFLRLSGVASLGGALALGLGSVSGALTVGEARAIHHGRTARGYPLPYFHECVG